MTRAAPLLALVVLVLALLACRVNPILPVVTVTPTPTATETVTPTPCAVTATAQAVATGAGRVEPVATAEP